MSEKIFTDILSELKSINERIGNLESGQRHLKEGQNNLSNSLTRLENIVTHIKNGHGEKLSTLLDGHKQNTEILDRHTEQLKRIEEIIESHDIQISVFRSQKSKSL